MPDRFKTPLNRPSNITSDDYVRAQEYVGVVKAIEQIAYESIYIIDYFKGNFLYVSQNPLMLCGLTPDEVMVMGYGFYISHVPKNDLKLLLKINDISFRFFNKLPKEERKLYSISYDFHIKTNDDSILINHRLVPLELDKDGHLWLAMCYVSLSHNDCAGNIRVRKSGQTGYRYYDLSRDEWVDKEEESLSIKEKEVLMLAARGLTIDEIAQRLNRSKDAIKSRRKIIFDKLGVGSIRHAIAFAVSHKLI